MTEKNIDFTSKTAAAFIVWLFLWPVGWIMARSYKKHAELLKEEGYTVTGAGCLSVINFLTILSLIATIALFLMMFS